MQAAVNIICSSCGSGSNSMHWAFEKVIREEGSNRHAASTDGHDRSSHTRYQLGTLC